MLQAELQLQSWLGNKVSLLECALQPRDSFGVKVLNHVFVTGDSISAFEALWWC